MKGITTGPLEVREDCFGWEVHIDDGQHNGDGFPIATFTEPPNGTAEANARAFIMVGEMVEALREVVRTYGSMETGDGEPYPVVANARAILARIDGSAGHD